MPHGNFFEFDGEELVLNTPEILLVKEFSRLWEPDRNKCKEDKSGKQRLKARKELKFIWLMYNYRSPYREFESFDKFNAAKDDSELTSEELKDEDFVEACKKYQKLIVTRYHKLIEAANETCDKITLFLKTIDLDERKADGSLIFNHKNVMDSLAKVRVTVSELLAVEKMIEKEYEGESSIRGDAEKGLFD